ncbi:hypothetical protein JCM1393_28940 [Clostridium carnis]
MNVITKLEVQKRNKERVNLYIDEEYAFSLSAEIVYKEGIKVKDNIDIEKIKKIAKEDEYIKCKNSALRIVEKTYKSQKELIDKLILKGYEKDSIDKTIEFLKQYNFLNDENYTKMYIKDKMKSQGQNKIKYTLIKKGINEELIKDEIANINSDTQREVAYSLGKKKYDILCKKESDKYKLSQKLYRYLISKGYEYDIVSNVVKNIIKVEDSY